MKDIIFKNWRTSLSGTLSFLFSIWLIVFILNGVNDGRFPFEIAAACGIGFIKELSSWFNSLLQKDGQTEEEKQAEKAS